MVLFAGGIYYNFYFILPNVVPWSRFHLIGFLDVLIICGTAFHIIKLLLFFVHILVSVEFVYHFYMLDMEVMVRSAMSELKKTATEKRPLLELKLAQLLTFYTLEVRVGLRNAVFANEYLVSPLLTYGACSHFSFNLYLFVALYFVPFSPGDKVMVYCLIGLQTTFLFEALQAAVKLGNDLETPGKLMGGMQAYIGANTAARTWNKLFLTRTKLRVLYLYEQLHSHEAFRFTLGPLGKITNKSVFEVSFFSCFV